MILAAAQTAPVRYDIDYNLNDHYRYIDAASANGVDLIVFPEMSITGYERDAARELCFTPDDMRLAKFRDLVVKHNMIIIAGAPINIAGKLYIGSFIIYHDRSVDIYTKQYLHTGEELFYASSFDHDPVIEFGNERIGLAICYDIEVQRHVRAAKNSGCTIYIPSIYYSPDSMEQARRLLSNVARQYNMNVLMTNYTGHPWETPAGGQSAFWNNRGSLVASLNGHVTGLLIVQNENDDWSGQMIPIL